MPNAITFALVAILVATSSFAADEAKVRAYVKKAGFADEIKKSVRDITKGNPNPNTEKLLAEINFASIEDRYAKALAGALTDADIAALSKSLDIPGLREASRKQGIASQQLFGFISQEIERAAKAVGLGK